MGRHFYPELFEGPTVGIDRHVLNICGVTQVLDLGKKLLQIRFSRNTNNLHTVCVHPVFLVGLN
jgi:hypothetical protein